MTGRAFAIASGKGGVGKTTTAVNLSAAATEAGRSVVLVDYDLGMANLGDVLDTEAETPTLHDALAGEADPLDTTRPTDGGFDVVVGGTDIEDFGRADPAKLRGVVDELQEEYDIVVVDTGGGLSHDTTVPLGVADDVILVSTPTADALENTEKTNNLVERLDGDVHGIVFTRVGGGGQVDISNTETNRFGGVLGNIPEDRTVPESAAAGEPVIEHAPESPAAQSYREFGYGLLDESVPLSFRDDSDDNVESQNATTEPLDGNDGVLDEGDAVHSGGDDERDVKNSRSLVSKLTGGLLG